MVFPHVRQGCDFVIELLLEFVPHDFLLEPVQDPQFFRNTHHKVGAPKIFNVIDLRMLEERASGSKTEVLLFLDT